MTVIGMMGCWNTFPQKSDFFSSIFTVSLWSVLLSMLWPCWLWLLTPRDRRWYDECVPWDVKPYSTIGGVWWLMSVNKRLSSLSVCDSCPTYFIIKRRFCLQICSHSLWCDVFFFLLDIIWYYQIIIIDNIRLCAWTSLSTTYRLTKLQPGFSVLLTHGRTPREPF